MKILLVDGNNLAVASNFAGAPLSTRAGVPTRAIVGFLKCLRSYVDTFDPGKIFVVWDGGKSKKRLESLPTYKESRAMELKTPEQAMNFQELFDQLPVIKEAVLTLGLGSVSGPGVEADDLIALMAQKADQINHEAVIISSDTDFHQLVTKNISVFSPRTTEKHRHVTHKNFSAVHDGLTPEQYLDYKALLGDTSDDVPGVAGIGPKRALALLTEYKSIDTLQNPGIALSQAAKKVVAQWPEYCLSKSLINLYNPLADVSAARINRRPPEWGQMRAIALSYEIASIYEDFETWCRPYKQLQQKGT